MGKRLKKEITSLLWKGNIGVEVFREARLFEKKAHGGSPEGKMCKGGPHWWAQGRGGEGHEREGGGGEKAMRPRSKKGAKKRIAFRQRRLSARNSAHSPRRKGKSQGEKRLVATGRGGGG